MKEYEFHPLAMEYRRMSAHDLGRMEESMIERGFDPRFPIILYAGMILDGCNRYLAAMGAKVKPIYVTFEGTDDEAAAFVQLANEERRHLTLDELQTKRGKRLARVKAGREAGKSIRALASEEGVSKSQIERDIDETDATVPGGTVEGKDGRTRTATPKKPDKPAEPAPMVVDASPRTAEQESAYEQAVVDHAARNGERQPPKEKPLVDNDGKKVPDRLKKFFLESPLFGSAIAACHRAKEALRAVEASEAYQLAETFTADNPGGDRRIYSTACLTAVRKLEAMRPALVCVECTGQYEPSPDSELCPSCQGRGYLMGEDLDE